MPRSQKGLYSPNTEVAQESYYQKRGMQIASDAKLAKIIWKSLQVKQQNNPDRTQEQFTSQGYTIHKQVLLHIFYQLLNELKVSWNVFWTFQMILISVTLHTAPE